MIRLLSIICVFCATSVTGQTLPERYSVTNVAADDVLNIRSGPSSQADIIGSFGPYTLNVEVLDVRQNWAQVSTGEAMGWTSLRFLEHRPAPSGEIPRPLSCFGTEPFWSVTLAPRGAFYEDPETGARSLTPLRENIAHNGYLFETREGPTLTRTLIVNAQHCTDGMSDRNFGMSGLLFTEAPDGNDVQTGCCTFQVN